MGRMLARTGIAAMFMASAVLMSGGLQAHAASGGETVITYYNNSEHSKVVGIYWYGPCSEKDSGIKTSYATIQELQCSE